MAALKLTPQDTNYLSSRVVFEQLTQNSQAFLESNDDVTIDSEARVLLNGAGMAQLNGFVTIDADPVAAMDLCGLPLNLTPASEGVFPVAVQRGEAFVVNGVQVTSGGASVESVSVTAGGSYAVVPTMVTTGPGVGATFTAHMEAITATNVAAGSGYAPTNTITLTDGTATVNAILTVSTTKLVSVAVNAGGTGYVAGDTITLAGGTFSTAAVLTVATEAAGVITGVTISTAGSYTVNSATFTQASTSGSGTGATFQTGLFGVNTKAISNPGNYTALPSNPVAQGSTSGSGTGYTCNLTWGVLTVDVATPGEGYTSDSRLVFSSGAAAASLVLGPTEPSKVILLNAPTAADKIYLDSVSFLLQSYN